VLSVGSRRPGESAPRPCQPGGEEEGCVVAKSHIFFR
jgi:hypothetical protein